MLKVLFFCVENSCRSQMAEGLVNHFLAGQVQAFSAGIRPTQVNPMAIQVMAELGIDISRHRSKSVDELAGEHFDLVITVCDQDREQCPTFPQDTEVMHVRFPHLGRSSGSGRIFRKMRDALRERLGYLLRKKLKDLQGQGQPPATEW